MDYSGKFLNGNPAYPMIDDDEITSSSLWSSTKTSDEIRPNPFDQDLNTNSNVTFNTVSSFAIGIGESPTANLSIKSEIGQDAEIRLDTKDSQDTQIRFKNTGIDKWKIVNNAIDDSLSFKNGVDDEVLTMNQDGQRIVIGQTGSNYTLPTSRGNTGQILQDSGSGSLDWVDSSATSDQSLNTFDNVEFESVKVETNTQQTSILAGLTAKTIAGNNSFGYIDGFTKTRGTIDVQTPILSGDILKNELHLANGGAGNAQCCSLTTTATANHTATNFPVKYEIKTTNNNTAGLQQKLMIDNDGTTIYDELNLPNGLLNIGSNTNTTSVVNLNSANGGIMDINFSQGSGLPILEYQLRYNGDSLSLRETIGAQPIFNTNGSKFTVETNLIVSNGKNLQLGTNSNIASTNCVVMKFITSTLIEKGRVVKIVDDSGVAKIRKSKEVTLTQLGLLGSLEKQEQLIQMLVFVLVGCLRLLSETEKQ
jgi:hypothetical protein